MRLPGRSARRSALSRRRIQVDDVTQSSGAERQTAVSDAYPTHREAHIALRDGSTVHVRPIRPGDEGRLLDLLTATVEDRLSDAVVRWSPEAALTVVMAADGYPGPYAKGAPIAGLDKAAAVPGVRTFHAGTALRDGQVVTNGGRLLGVTATGPTIAEARERAYAASDLIRIDGSRRRGDIALDAEKR